MDWKLDPAMAMENSRRTLHAPDGAGNQRKDRMMVEELETAGTARGHGDVGQEPDRI
jgi:hypothetical protein